MKKAKYLTMAVLAMFLVLIVGFTGCSETEEVELELPLVGGYSEDRDLTEEDMAVFERAMSGLTGVVYEPIRVATQIVAGTNYRFTCTTTVVAPDAEPYTAFIYIFQPSGDREPEIISIEREE